MVIWLAIGLAFAASLAFGGLQTWNLRACQRQSAKAIAEHAVAIEKQNIRVSEWESKAKLTQAKAVEAGKRAAETAKVAKQKEAAIMSQPKPPEGGSCEEERKAVLDLLRRARTP